jgi:hypothetical protein
MEQMPQDIIKHKTRGQVIRVLVDPPLLDPLSKAQLDLLRFVVALHSPFCQRCPRIHSVFGDESGKRAI